MFTPFILFLGLTVATAVIAHWSDNLGKKLGKKRVSIFGLRPRTTATILTVASSWGIMLFTLAALLITVVPLRRSLFFYDRDISNAKNQLSSAQTKLSGTQRSLSQTQTSLSDAQSQLSGLQISLDNTTKKFNQAQKATDAAQKANDAAQKRAKDAQDREKQARQSERIAAQSADRAAQEVENARGRLVVIGQRLNTEQRSLGIANSRLATTNSRLGRVRQKFQSAQSNYARAQSNYARAQGNYARAREAALRIGPTVLQLQNQANRARADVDLLLKQRTELLDFAAKAMSFVGSDAPIKVRQTFAAGVIGANQTPAAIAVQLRQLLRQGQQSFAESEENSPIFPPDAKIQLLPLTGTDASGKPTLLEGERLLQSLAREIASGGQTTSIRLVAPRNYLANEKIIEAIFVAIPIAPAFAAGEVLASTTIDGAQGDARVFRSLLDLTNLGRSQAEKRGVNPPELFDVTNFYANDTNVRLFAALRFIADSKDRLRVNLVADKALSTVEPLQVRFEIESGVPDAPASNAPSSRVPSS